MQDHALPLSLLFTTTLLVLLVTGRAAHADEARPAAAPPPPAKGDVTIPAGDLKKLQEAAQQRGWRTRRNAAGDLLLYPPGKGVTQAADERGSAGGTAVREGDASGDVILPATDLDRLEQTLRARGWRTRRTPDGDLILQPPQKSPPANASAAESAPASEPGCRYQRLAPVRDGRIALPVDSWQKARRLAEAWLAENGDTHLQPGRIRRVNRLYIVSLVDDSPPYRLRRQLVIYIPDGRVLAIP